MIARRSAMLGGLAGLLLSAVFVGVVGWAAGWVHLVEQVKADWWILLPLVLGFAAQIALMAELRQRRRGARAAAVSAGAGGSASALGMVACCAHHVADLAPLAGATGVATFLTEAQRPFMIAGLAISVVGVIVGMRRLHRFGGPEVSCDTGLGTNVQQQPVGAGWSR
jgi:hypothetical protein